MLLARDYNPSVKLGGAKWMPYDLAGMIGLPYIGDIYYVDPTNGADTNSGKDHSNAFATLAKAYAAVTDNHHDVIIITPGGVGTGTGTVEVATITWAKNLVHVVGNVMTGPYSSRARVTCATAGVSPLITLSGSGNSFHNIQIANGAATNFIGVTITGSRNMFENCQIGVTNAVAFDTATATDIQFTGGSENYFVNCIIGFDTIARTAASASVTFASSSARNLFDNCIFPMFADAAAPFFVKIGASGIDRSVDFRGCQFLNYSNIGATTLTDATSIDANPGGSVLLDNCAKLGTTGWSDNVAQVYAIGSSSNATYANGIGFVVNPAA
jgi:hypothetical protein